MNTWVREEAVRQIKATCERDRQRDGIPKGGHSPCCHAEEVAESCLRAGLAKRAEAIHELRAALAALDRWCDERREATTVTTLGHVQERIRAVLAHYPEEPSQGGTTP